MYNWLREGLKDEDKGYEYLDSVSVLKILSEEEMEEGKNAGKISFGAVYNGAAQDEKQAVEDDKIKDPVIMEEII